MKVKFALIVEKIMMSLLLTAVEKKWVLPESCAFAGNTLNVKKAKKIEVSFPLANYPMPCPHCEKTLWRFDMQKHVTKNHPDKECPSEGIISEAEKGILEKKKQRTANGLSVKDLEKLNEEELKLLPLKRLLGCY